MKFPRVLDQIDVFMGRLTEAKGAYPAIEWYPFNSLTTLHWLDHFTGAGREVFDHVGPGKSAIDIGSGDGDIAFFIESLGSAVTIVDNPATNLNDGLGLRQLKSYFDSKAALHFTDVDWQPWLPGEYDLAIMFGLLYHLRNPFMILDTIAHHAERLLMNTKVIGCLADGTKVANQPMSYLTRARELRDNPTNYWLLTPTAVRLMLKRCGWEVLDEFLTGDIDIATPHGADCRMYCYCRRVGHWRQLRLHHDF
jgi:tRNA (mo5U34)-methyltransferase